MLWRVLQIMLWSGGILAAGLALQDAIQDLRAGHKIGIPLSTHGLDWSNMIGLTVFGFVLGLLVVTTAIWVVYKAIMVLIWIAKLKV